MIQHRQANYFSSVSWDFDTSSSRGYHPSFNFGDTPYTAPLGNFSTNGYSLGDVAGNVREWCWDWAEQNYYAGSPGTNPRGPDAGTLRAVRGGAWSTQAIECRSSARFGAAPNTRSNDAGFRVVRSVVASG
jgi:sulfatase modifying factor 1